MILDVQIVLQSIVVALLESFLHEGQLEEPLIFHLSDHIDDSIGMIDFKVAQVVSHLVSQPNDADGRVCRLSHLIGLDEISNLFLSV